ncbi:MAG: extracellular solute-binding protein [Candidatus Hydrogenedentes bacterium]|nr:extracellular solute-binding protein [Candidatus Hydrogenedentota bacterium]
MRLRHCWIPAFAGMTVFGLGLWAKLTLAIAATCCLWAGTIRAEEVVIYTAHDAMFSRPILDDFETQSGINVRVAYDTEASKTTGLVNRLIAEKNNPRADVFWNNEVAQSIVLKERGILEAYHSPTAEGIPKLFKDADGYWTGFAARARVLIYNTDLVAEPPSSIFELTEPQWRGQVGIALPLFGTTATHAAALFAGLGDEKARDWFEALKANDAKILNGNATVKNRVADGEIKIGLTDTDDANAAVQDGKPTKWLFLDQDEGQLGTLVIPNSVCLIKGGPNPEAGKKLIDYLISAEVEERHARSRSMQMPLQKDAKVPENIPCVKDIRPMQVDFQVVAARMGDTARYIQEQFAR